MNIRKHATTGLLTIGVLVALAASLQADDMAYMLGTAALGVQNPLGIVDLKTGVFTLIGNMGSGGYDGLAVANGVLYTEQNGLLYSVNTSNANLTLIGGINGNNLAAFGSTTTGLYGLAGTGSNVVATLFSINPQTGAMTTIGPLGASAVPNGQGSYARLSVGSSTLYMEFNSNLYIINTTTGAATQVGTTDSNDYLTSVPLFENGTYYAGYWFRNWHDQRHHRPDHARLHAFRRTGVPGRPCARSSARRHTAAYADGECLYAHNSGAGAPESVRRRRPQLGRVYLDRQYGKRGIRRLGCCQRHSVHRTERTALFGQHGQRKSHPHRRSDRHPQSRHVRLNHHGTLRPGQYGFSDGGDSIFDQSPDGRHDGDWAARRQRRTQRSEATMRGFPSAPARCTWSSTAISYTINTDNRRGHAGGNHRQ